MEESAQRRGKEKNWWRRVQGMRMAEFAEI